MILIIDNYDSFTYNLVHLVAVVTDDYQVVRNDKITIEEIKGLNPAGILISPGPGRPENAGITEDVVDTFGEHIPILGVCLGHQAIGEAFGGEVVHAEKLMHGKTSQIYHDGKGIFEGLKNGFTATRYHSLTLDEDCIPQGFTVSAKSNDETVMGIRHERFPLEGIQFHPESLLTEVGDQIIGNWVEICGKENKTQISNYK